MKIGGHGLREHIRFLMPLFGLIAAVWLLRIVLDKAGAPPTVVRIMSVTVACAVSILLAVLLIHIKAFGSYANVVAATFLLELWSQSLISGAIAFSVVTGITNVFVAPEYSHSLSPLAHIIGHMTFGLGLGTLFGSAMGCLLLWMLRLLVRVTPGKTHAKTNL